MMVSSPDLKGSEVTSRLYKALSLVGDTQPEKSRENESFSAATC
jgi:hypothetical protein